MNGTEIAVIGDSDHGQSTFIAPHIIYHGSFSTDDYGPLPCSDEIVCDYGVNVTWLGEHRCIFNLMCPTLETNACGDFGSNFVSS